MHTAFRPGALVALVALLPACDYVNTDVATYGPAATTSGDGGAGFQLASSNPASGAMGVPLGAAIILTFTDFPDPASLAPDAAHPVGAVSLSSAKLNFDNTASVDLVNKAVVVTPNKALAPNTQYDVTVSTKVASLAGMSLPMDVTFSFTTGTMAGGGPTPPTMRTLATDVQPIFDKTCATAGCHDATTNSEGLSLASGQSKANLVGVASAEKMALSRVKANDPANSYLLRKILGTPDIVLQKMPTVGSLTDADIRTISDWIATGAN